MFSWLDQRNRYDRKDNSLTTKGELAQKLGKLDDELMLNDKWEKHIGSLFDKYECEFINDVVEEATNEEINNLIEIGNKILNK